MSKDNAAKAEPLRAFPWTGFFGGKVTRILIDYDDYSSKAIGDPESLTALQSEADGLRALARTQYLALKAFDERGYTQAVGGIMKKAMAEYEARSPQDQA